MTITAFVVQTFPPVILFYHFKAHACKKLIRKKRMINVITTPYLFPENGIIVTQPEFAVSISGKANFHFFA
jgi:hypothetical protein